MALVPLRLLLDHACLRNGYGIPAFNVQQSGTGAVIAWEGGRTERQPVILQASRRRPSVRRRGTFFANT